MRHLSLRLTTQQQKLVGLKGIRFYELKINYTPFSTLHTVQYDKSFFLLLPPHVLLTSLKTIWFSLLVADLMRQITLQGVRSEKLERHEQILKT